MVGRLVLVLAALVAASLLAGCSGSDDSAPRATPAPTPIGELQTGSVRLVRAPFCDRVPDSSVAAALGGDPTGSDSWGNGDPVPDTTGSSGDVGHEIGCAWSGADGASAGAWIFARPVPSGFATDLVVQAGAEEGCTATAARVFGGPSVLQTCTLPGNVQRVRRAGLFGDTWLTCEVSGASAPDLRTRTDRWCAAVVTAAAAG
jgi:hypothetical protein